MRSGSTCSEVQITVWASEDHVVLGRGDFYAILMHVQDMLNPRSVGSRSLLVGSLVGLAELIACTATPAAEAGTNAELDAELFGEITELGDVVLGRPGQTGSLRGELASDSTRLLPRAEGWGVCR
jgi:hypothetical protein